jgi:hypothetical protein
LEDKGISNKILKIEKNPSIGKTFLHQRWELCQLANVITTKKKVEAMKM